jgi:hypothetical protein
MRKTAIFAIVGALMFFWAATLPSYRDPGIVRDAMSIGPADPSESRAASQKYRAVRNSQLTWKFRLQDYGATALSLAVLLGGLSSLAGMQGVRSLLGIKTPARSWLVLAMGLAAALATTIADVASLLIETARDEYPPWADSIGIPLMNAPFILLVLTLVAGSFFWAGSVQYSGGMPVFRTARSRSSPRPLWMAVFGIPLLASVLATVSSAMLGDFVFVLPGAFWVMFFATLLAGRRRPAHGPVPPTETAV